MRKNYDYSILIRPCGALGQHSLPIYIFLTILLWITPSFSISASEEKPLLIKNQTVEMKDLDGKTVRPFQRIDKKAVALIFTTHDCPIANRYAPEIKRIHQDYASKGIQFYLVYVDPDLHDEKVVRQHQSNYQLEGIPTLVDRRHILVTATGAEITPEAVVVNPNGLILYRGRIYNLFPALGKARSRATRHEFRQVLKSVLEGKKTTIPWVKPVGCYIPTLGID